MNAKEYLSQAYRLDMAINTRMQEVDRLRSLTQRMTTFYAPDRQGQPCRDAHASEDAIIRLMEAEEALNREIDRLVALKEEISRVIRQVDDDLCEMVLTKRYLCYMQWEEIAREMHYSRRWVMNLHQRGIEAVEGILEFR